MANWLYTLNKDGRPGPVKYWNWESLAWRGIMSQLLWRHNGRNAVSNDQLHDCLVGRLFRRRSKKTSKLCITGLWAGNSPGTGEFPTQMASNVENVSIWRRHHANSAMRSAGTVMTTVWTVCLSIKFFWPSMTWTHWGRLMHIWIYIYILSVVQCSLGYVIGIVFSDTISVAWCDRAGQLAAGGVDSGGRVFDPCRVHDNLSVPLWVYMHFPVP